MAGAGPSACRAAALPRVDHIVVVIEENHSYDQILRPSPHARPSDRAPFMMELARRGASFTRSYGIRHPSQPNYLDLFSGADQGLPEGHDAADACIRRVLTAPNLASDLRSRGLTFCGYAEDLPVKDLTKCKVDRTYVRRHCPWINFAGLATAGYSRPWPAFTADLSRGSLPSVAFVIPNLKHDMHDGSINAADLWLQTNIGPFITWARNHNGLLIVTWDEDQLKTEGDLKRTLNRIPTLFVGPMVKPGQYAEPINHFSVLRTIEALFSLPHMGIDAVHSRIDARPYGGPTSARSQPITDIWRALPRHAAG